MRALGLVFFLLVIGVIGFVIVRGGAASGLATDGFGDADDGELGVAEDAAGDIRDLEDIARDAIRNARQAQGLADEMDEAAREARDAADALMALSSDNEAARLSAEAAVIAAEDAEDAAVLMRRYATSLLARFRDLDAAAGEAEAIADMAIEVEETQAAAVAAAAAAREARAEMARTQDAADDYDPRLDAGRDGAPAAYGGDIVIIDERGTGKRRTGDADQDEDVGQRLDEIFPDDVIDYGEGDEDYVRRGERG